MIFTISVNCNTAWTCCRSEFEKVKISQHCHCFFRANKITMLLLILAVRFIDCNIY